MALINPASKGPPKSRILLPILRTKASRSTPEHSSNNTKLWTKPTTTNRPRTWTHIWISEPAANNPKWETHKISNMMNCWISRARDSRGKRTSTFCRIKSIRAKSMRRKMMRKKNMLTMKQKKTTLRTRMMVRRTVEMTNKQMNTTIWMNKSKMTMPPSSKTNNLKTTKSARPSLSWNKSATQHPNSSQANCNPSTPRTKPTSRPQWKTSPKQAKPNTSKPYS